MASTAEGPAPSSMNASGGALQSDWNTKMPDMRKLALYEQFAKIGKALANPVRLVLLDLLAQRECSVEALAEEAGMKVGNTSAQLKVLNSAGLLTTRRAGTRVFYRLADDGVGAFVEQVQEFAAARLGEVKRRSEE